MLFFVAFFSLLLCRGSLALQQCPVWATTTNCSMDECVCKPDFTRSNKRFSCGESTIGIGVCLSRFNGSNETAAIGSCTYSLASSSHLQLKNFYEFSFANVTTVSLAEVEESLCGSLNRQGLLCSECKPGYGPAVYAFGFSCADCSATFSGWGVYLFLQLLPLTVFYMAVLLFNIKVSSPSFMTFVIFCSSYSEMERSIPQVRAIIDTFAFPEFYKVVQTLFGFWNLDFFRHLIPPFCVDSRLNNIQGLCLEYISAAYPLLLVTVTYVAIQLHGRNFKPIVIFWKPFHKCCVRIRRKIDPKSSVINTFATFLVLSIHKTIYLSVIPLVDTRISTLNPIRDSDLHFPALYYNPQLSMDRPYVATLVTILIITFTLLMLIPMIILCFYPVRAFRRLLTSLRVDSTSLMIFIELFQGDFKNGTNNTRDYRSLSGLYLLVKILIALCFIDHLTYVNKLTFAHLLAPTISLGLLLLVSIIQPYRKNRDNCLAIFNLFFSFCVTAGFLLMLPALAHLNKIEIAFHMLTPMLLLPHVVIFACALYKLQKNVSMFQSLKTRCILGCNKSRALTEYQILMD